jgi:hypothetical protein
VALALVDPQEGRERETAAIALNNLGIAYSHLGDARRAVEAYQRALPAFQAAGDEKGVETARKNIAQLYADRRSHSALDEHE